MPVLVDTSAWWAAKRDARIHSAFGADLVGGEIATCDMVTFELLFSARNPGELDRLRGELSVLEQCSIGSREWRRALDVYGEACRRGPGNDAHRRFGHEDLLIAAAAEAAGMTLLHYDADFDAIAEITGQPARWIAPRGSL